MDFAGRPLSWVTNLFWFAWNFPIFKTESTMSWEALLSVRHTRTVGHPRDRKKAMEWIIRNLRSIKIRSLLSHGNVC